MAWADTEEFAAPQRYQRKWQLKQYGITQEDFDRMLAEQEAVCALCGGPPTRGHKRLCVDHSHETGRVRGLLCHSCNLGIGKLNDDPTLLRKAADYVERA